ncbi:hypothetical protein [Verrucomicrobium spinosum]|nr:hypothetical protein [Verrucomicrobium spinosum]
MKSFILLTLCAVLPCSMLAAAEARCGSSSGRDRNPTARGPMTIPSS